MIFLTHSLFPVNHTKLGLLLDLFPGRLEQLSIYPHRTLLIDQKKRVPSSLVIMSLLGVAYRSIGDSKAAVSPKSLP